MAIFGESGNDVLRSGSGHDLIDGGPGADLMIGGIGHDVYFVENPNDRVIERTDGEPDDIIASDTLVGDGERDILKGGPGDNLLDGGPGKDRLIGGPGSDTFVWKSADETGGRGRTADHIVDYSRLDTIDLSAVDANSERAGEQSFDFIGASHFSSTLGELRYANGFLQGDRDGDRRPDFLIRLESPSVSWLEDSLII